MGPWIMFLFVNIAILYFIYIALLRPQVVVGWLGTRVRRRLDRQFRYRAIVRMIGLLSILGLGMLNWLLWQWG